MELRHSQAGEKLNVITFYVLLLPNWYCTGTYIIGLDLDHMDFKGVEFLCH
jgi:hypothetical protein